MKGIKIVFPIMGVFLVLYIALVVMNSAKMNGIVSHLNKEYDEDFVIIASTVGNVFTDDDFFVTARSEKTGRLYEFEYNAGEISGEYALENRTIELVELVKQQLPKEAVVVAKLAGVVDAEVEVEQLQFNELKVMIVGSSSTINQKEIERYLSNTYDESGNIEVTIMNATKSQIEKIQTELIDYLPYSSIHQEHLENYLE